MPSWKTGTRPLKQHGVYKMKLQIYSKENSSSIIENIQTIEIKEISEDLLPNDSVMQIIVEDALSYVDNDDFMKCLDFCAKKLRLGGECFMQDIDIDLLCKNTIRNRDTDYFNRVIKNKINVHPAILVKKIMTEMNLICNTLEFSSSESKYNIKFTKQ